MMGFQYMACAHWTPRPRPHHPRPLTGFRMMMSRRCCSWCCDGTARLRTACTRARASVTELHLRCGTRCVAVRRSDIYKLQGMRHCTAKSGGHHLSAPVWQSFLRRFPPLALRSGQYHTRKASAASSCAPIASPPLICMCATDFSSARHVIFTMIKAPTCYPTIADIPCKLTAMSAVLLPKHVQQSR